jgi:hypothetical protein
MQLHAALSEQGVAVRFCHRVAGTEASAGGYSTPLPRDAEVSPPTHCHCEPPLHLCTRGTWGHRASCNTNTSSSDGCRAIQHRTLQQIGPSVSPILMPCAYSELSARLSTPPSRPFYPTGSDAKPAASVCSSRLTRSLVHIHPLVRDHGCCHRPGSIHQQAGCQGLSLVGPVHGCTSRGGLQS